MSDTVNDTDNAYGEFEKINEAKHKALDALQLSGNTTIHDLINFIRQHLLVPRSVVNAATEPNPPVIPAASYNAERHYQR